MTKEGEILSNIRSAVDKYNSIQLEDLKEMSEVLRTLSSNSFYLEA